MLTLIYIKFIFYEFQIRLSAVANVLVYIKRRLPVVSNTLVFSLSKF